MFLPVVSILLLACPTLGVSQTPNPHPTTVKPSSSHGPVPEFLEETTIGINDGALRKGKGADYGDYIVGGSEVSHKHELGYQALVWKCRNGCGYCGGTVIHQRYVITAAHCLYMDEDLTIPFKTLYVVVGEHNICNNLTGPNSSEGRQKFKASEVFEHPKFNKTTAENDIAILKLPQDIIFNDRVWPACLPASDTMDYTGQSVIASGWGLTEGYIKGQEIPEQDKQCILKKTTLKIMAYSDLVCSRVLKSKKPDASRLCAYYPGRDACHGDSGGPLTLKQGDRYVLLGVTSYGLGCADTRNAGIFARVQGFLPWIAEKIPDTEACGRDTALMSSSRASPANAPLTTVAPTTDTTPSATTVSIPKKGIWTSPNFPSNYPNNFETNKTITVSQGSIVKIRFISFDLEGQMGNERGGRECRDYLSAEDGDGTMLMYYSCGSHLPKTITSRTNKVIFTFVTNKVFALPGFKLAWEAMINE